MGLSIALGSEGMSSPCKALGLILSTKRRGREEPERGRGEREVHPSVCGTLFLERQQELKEESGMRDLSPSQSTRGKQEAVGACSHPQESTQHMAGLTDTRVTLSRAIYSLQGKVPK